MRIAGIDRSWIELDPAEGTVLHGGPSDLLGRIEQPRRRGTSTNTRTNQDWASPKNQPDARFGWTPPSTR